MSNVLILSISTIDNQRNRPTEYLGARALVSLSFEGVMTLIDRNVYIRRNGTFHLLRECHGGTAQASHLGFSRAPGWARCKHALNLWIARFDAPFCLVDACASACVQASGGPNRIPIALLRRFQCENPYSYSGAIGAGGHTYGVTVCIAFRKSICRFVIAHQVGRALDPRPP